MNIDLRHGRITPVAGDIMILREDGSTRDQYFIFAREEFHHPEMTRDDCKKYIINLDSGVSDAIAEWGFGIGLTSITTKSGKLYFIERILDTEFLEIREI